MPRPSSLALAVLGLAGIAFAAALVDADRLVALRQPDQEQRRQLTARLGLTDLALFTEARYTRHPSQADWHAAFQDHPAALEHFPTGSLLPPPALLRETHAPLAGKTASPD